MSWSSAGLSDYRARGADQSFNDVHDLLDYVKTRRDHSERIGHPLDLMVPIPGSAIEGGADAVYIGNRKRGSAARLNHHSFGQLASFVPGLKGCLPFMRTHSNQLAASMFTEAIKRSADRKDLQVLETSTDEGLEIRAVNSPSYGVIWDHEMVDEIMEHIDLSQWQVPAASRMGTNKTKATTCYASDRDVYMFLCNASNPIEIPGSTGRDLMFRGFIAKNSEVGGSSLTWAQFLYRKFCDNRMIWGMEEKDQVRIRHTSGAPMRFAAELAPKVQQFLQSGTQDTVQKVLAAQNFEVGKEKKEVIAWTIKHSGVTKAVAESAYDRAEEEEGNPHTVWNIQQGITAIARDRKHQDARVQLETQAGKLMRVVNP